MIRAWAGRVIDFNTFGRQFWKNATESEEFDVFFQQCENQKPNDGKCFAKVCEAPKGLTIDIHSLFDESKETIDFGTDTMVGVTLLHVMEDLFDSSEYSPLDLSDL